jgi:hypothetical protein
MRADYKGGIISGTGACVNAWNIPLIAAMCMATALAGCNSTDALIPQVDVGVTTQSTPLTQRDLDRAASDSDQYANYRSAPSQQSNSYQAQSSNYPPQNTLEAQAQALQSDQPRLSTRLYQQMPAGSEPQQSQMLPAPVQSDEQDRTGQSEQPMDMQQPVQQAVQPQPQTQQASVAPQGAKGTIRFLPIIGAPLAAVTPLSRELGNSARSSGLTILSSSDTAAENILKGYLSAFEDGDNVNVVYVWDVLDGSGNRLHRLQGQQSAPKQGSDPWASANPQLMQEIAKTSIASYIQWKSDHGN